MIMTNKQIVEALDELNAIKYSDRRLPVRVSYAINKNIGILLSLYQPYLETLRSIGEENHEAVAELLNTPNDVQLHKVTLDQIDSADLSIKEVYIIQTYMMEE